VVLIVCVLGALGTVIAGSWQGARFATRPQPKADCGMTLETSNRECRIGSPHTKQP
jgi:hypothetical protein